MSYALDWWGSLKDFLPLLFVGGIVAAFIADNRQNKRAEQQFKAMQERKLTEEGILEAQSKLEERIEKLKGLPDRFYGKDIYIYRNFINPWFWQLSARWRYNDQDKLAILRADYASYFEKLKDQTHYRFMWLGYSDNSEKYESNYGKARGSVVAIEDGFANAVGQNAVAELKRIRELDIDKINDDGELAPDGYRFTIACRDGDGKIVQVLKAK